MVIRSVIPRVQQITSRALIPCRQYCSRRGPRLVPMWGPWRDHWPGTSLVGRFFNDPPSMFAQQFKGIEKIMDRFMSPRWWDGDFPRHRCRGREMEVKYDRKVFEVRLDVSLFTPEDIKVTVNESDRILVISAKHKEKPDDHGCISREFNRQILIPENVEMEEFQSLLTNDGHLVVRAKVEGAEEIKERVIDIQKEEPKEDEKTKEKD
nr:small heat shock protein [Phascolopsis gouldii]